MVIFGVFLVEFTVSGGILMVLQLSILWKRVLNILRDKYLHPAKTLSCPGICCELVPGQC